MGGDSSDFFDTVDNYIRISKLSVTSKGIIKEAVDHSKFYYLLRLAKNLIGIAVGVFTFSALMLNYMIVSVFFCASLSLVSAVLSIQIRYIKDTESYKLIEFY